MKTKNDDPLFDNNPTEFCERGDYVSEDLMDWKVCGLQNQFLFPIFYDKQLRFK